MAAISATAINQLSIFIDNAASGISSQMPDVLHQIILWGIVGSAMYQVGAILIMAALSGIIFYAFKRRQDAKYEGFWESDDAFGGFFVIALIISIISMIVFLCNFDWVHCVVAPKEYLIQYAAGLVK